MPVERTTPQLVKKGKGKKRPGYRGSDYGDQARGTGAYSGGPPGNKGEGSTDRSRVSAQQEKNHRDAMAAAQQANQEAKQKAKTKNLTKFGYAKPKSKFGGILGTIAGMMLGIPGLGLLTGGLGSLKDKFNDVTNNPNDLSLRERLTGYKTQKEYDDARRDRQLQGRLDDMYSAKSKGKGFSQKNIDKIEAMGFSPSTAQNVLTGRDLKGFTPSRMGLQTPQTFSDPFANTVGTTTKVNAPASDAVSSYSYGKADAAIPGVETTPSYINEFLNKPRTPGKSSPFSNFIDNLYNSKQILELEDQFGSKYGITNTSSGKASNARHMAAMNNLSTSLSPFDNKFGNFIGDTGAFAAGLINELPALGRGFNKKNLGEIGEDIAANFRGSFGTPNQTTAEDIYSNVFEGSTPARTASVPTYGTAAAAEISPIGLTSTGDIGFNTSGRLGNLSTTVDAVDALRGKSIDPQFNYSGTFDNTLLGGQTDVYGNYSDDVQKLGLNFNNDRGLYGGVEYDAITGEPKANIGFRKTFEPGGGLSSMFTRRR